MKRELREQRAYVVVFFLRYNVGVCERGFLGQERHHLHHGRSVSACVFMCVMSVFECETL
jgi:hypothetical protein